MTKVRIVTGFTPIPGHPRKEEEYHRLAKQFHTVHGALRTHYETPLSDCWLQQWLGKYRPVPFLVSRGDNPEKNTEAYHVVQHQKAEWLKLATMADDDAETFIWLDYGIFHQGVTATVISDFLKRVRLNDFALPGCAGYSREWPDTSPNWRFLGSLMIVPRQHISAFDALVKLVTKERIRINNRLSWEVNDWARVEALSKLPIRHYEADHNETQFTNYV